MADEVHMEHFLTIFRTIDFSQEPFEDDTDFESFVHDESSRAQRIRNYDSPLKLYKYLLVKLAIPLKFKRVLLYSKEVSKKLAEKLAEFKKTYRSFLQKQDPMTAEEKRYVKSAFASFQLAEIVLSFKGQDSKVEKFDFLKLKEICSDLLGCYNAGGEETIGYLLCLCADLLPKFYYQTTNFLLCVMTEILKKTREVKTRLGSLPQDAKMEEALKSIELSVEKIKLKCLDSAFTSAGTWKKFESIEQEAGCKIPKDDAVKANMLIELFKNHESDDEFREVPLKIQSYDQAKAVHELILRLADKLEPKDEDDVWDADHYKGLACGNLAAFATDPAEVYRLSKTSYDLLEGARKLKYKHSNCMHVMETIDTNLQRMWKIKYEIYSQEKSAENLKEIKEVASKRILFAQFLLKVSLRVPTICNWLIELDLVECVSKVYGHYSCAQKFAESIYFALRISPWETSKFNRAAGIQFEDFGQQQFAEALIRKFDPNVVKVKNPFLDGSNFETFVALYYDDLPEDILAEADLTTPINIYKFMLLTLIAEPYKRGEKFKDSHALMLNKIKDVKAKYKKFLKLKISMTPEDQKHVRSAYAVVRLAEMSLNVNKEGTKTENFDFKEFKGICIALMDGFSGETSIDYLKRVLDHMYDNRFYEVSRFVACVMTEILKQSLEVRAKNDTISQYCSCVAEKFMDLQMEVNHYNYELVHDVLKISNYILKNPSTPFYKIVPSDTNNGKMLMQLFENFEGDNADFQKFSLKARNYAQARQMYDLILKLTLERDEIGEVRHHDDRISNQGASMSKFADFEPNQVEKYQLLETSTDYLVEFLEKHPAGLTGFSSDSLRTSLEALEENLKRMWTIKLGIYNRHKTLENRKALKDVSKKRIKWGLLYVEHHNSQRFEFETWWTFLDMMKCHLKVFGDQAAAKECAASVWVGLIVDPSEIADFGKATGLSFKPNKQQFIDSLILKYQ